MTEIEQLKQELAATKQKLAGAQEWGQEVRGRYDNLCLESAQIINVWALAVQELEATRQRLEEAEKHLLNMFRCVGYRFLKPNEEIQCEEAATFLRVNIWTPIAKSTPTGEATGKEKG